MFLRSAPYVIIVALIAALSWATHLYLGKRDELSALTASVKTLGEAAQARVEQEKKQSAENLKKVTDDHEKLIPAIRDGAIAAYRLRHPDARRSPMSANAVGKPVANDPIGECLPDTALIENAAEDASKLSAWQEWCVLNQCPIQSE